MTDNYYITMRKYRQTKYDDLSLLNEDVRKGLCLDAMWDAISAASQDEIDILKIIANRVPNGLWMKNDKGRSAITILVDKENVRGVCDIIKSVTLDPDAKNYKYLKESLYVLSDEVIEALGQKYERDLHMVDEAIATKTGKDVDDSKGKKPADSKNKNDGEGK